MPCVILTPVSNSIEPAVDDALKELEKRSYPVWRVRGYSAIDQGRNQLATDAMEQGFDETFWIDADVLFQPDDVEKLRAHNLPLCSGIYPKKGRRELASHVLPGTKELTFGVGGGLVELLYAATGFLHVRREVYLTMQQKLRLPICNTAFGHNMIPFFQPLVVRQARAESGKRKAEEGESPEALDSLNTPLSAPNTRAFAERKPMIGNTPPVLPRYWYLAEDFAFSERARQAGFKIWADTTIRLKHIGSYGYSWEDAGQELPRFATYGYSLGGGK